jgi:hypothetical protein
MRADDPDGAETKEMRVIAGPGEPPPPGNMHYRVRRMKNDGPQEMETVTFLGVATGTVDQTLGEQLGLPKGTGLVVGVVTPDSPAASVLKRNDVLTKLDDQILITERQLSVLIRNHKEGDEVTLTYIRLGKESTARVKLGKHEVPKMAMFEGGRFGPGTFNFNFGDDIPGMGREEMDRVLSLMDQHAPGHMKRMHIDRHPEPGMRHTTVNTANSNMVFSDEQGSLDLTIKDGKKTLVAKDAKGTQLFSGPVDTPEQRAALPKEVRSRLDKLEGMQEFSFQTDDDFQGGRVKVVQPGKTKIALPQRAIVAPAESGSAPF